MNVYHRTTPAAAAAIMERGFTDGHNTYLTDREWTGVWVSDHDLAGLAEPGLDALIRLQVADDVLCPHEWVEEGASHREFLVPAQILNVCPRWLEEPGR